MSQLILSLRITTNRSNHGPDRNIKLFKKQCEESFFENKVEECIPTNVCFKEVPSF